MKNIKNIITINLKSIILILLYTVSYIAQFIYGIFMNISIIMTVISSVFAIEVFCYSLYEILKDVWKLGIEEILTALFPDIIIVIIMCTIPVAVISAVFSLAANLISNIISIIPKMFVHIINKAKKMRNNCKAKYETINKNSNFFVKLLYIFYFVFNFLVGITEFITTKMTIIGLLFILGLSGYLYTNKDTFFEILNFTSKGEQNFTLIFIITIMLMLVFIACQTTEYLKAFCKFFYSNSYSVEDLIDFVDDKKIKEVKKDFFNNSQKNQNEMIDKINKILSFLSEAKNFEKKLGKYAEYLGFEEIKNDLSAYCNYADKVKSCYNKIANNNITVIEINETFRYMLNAEQFMNKINRTLNELIHETKWEKNTQNTSSYQSNVKSIFFQGCETKDKLEKTYKSLCRAYHPDNGGDEETFKRMNEEYNKLHKQFN